MDRVTLSVPADDDFGGTLRLVVGGIGSRSQLSYEQVDELQLAVEALVSHREVVGGRVAVEADIDGHVLVLRVGPFAADEDRPGRRVVDRLVEGVRVLAHDDAEWVELAVSGRPAGVGS